MALIKGNRMFFTLVAMLILFNMVVVTSVAWFTMNRETDADKMGMALAVDDTVALYKAYMYDLANGKGTDEITIKNGDTTTTTDLNIANIELNPYDTIFKGQNKYTPIFAKIELVRTSTMPLNGTVNVTIERDLDVHEEGYHYSSSILRFTAFVIPEHAESEYEGDANKLYNYINSIERFNAVETYTGVRPESKNFDSGSTDSNSLTVSVSYSEQDWYTRGNDQVLNVYLYITYDATLIAEYMSTQPGGSMSLDDNTLSFENDLTRIRVSYTD